MKFLVHRDTLLQLLVPLVQLLLSLMLVWTPLLLLADSLFILKKHGGQSEVSEVDWGPEPRLKRTLTSRNERAHTYVWIICEEELKLNYHIFWGTHSRRWTTSVLETLTWNISHQYQFKFLTITHTSKESKGHHISEIFFILFNFISQGLVGLAIARKKYLCLLLINDTEF